MSSSPSRVPPEAAPPSPTGEPAAWPRSSPYFIGRIIDDDPELLRASYALRYQVYCHERNFLPPDAYPEGMEIDEFDQHSIHMGVINTRGELAATGRLVQLTAAGLPSFDHCTFYAGVNVLRDLERRVVEVSRVAVSRSYNRRADDQFFSLGSAPPRTEGGERRRGGLLVMTLYKIMWQTSKRLGITNWLAATEKALHRMVTRSGLPFRQVGPETDYYGPVSPYLLDIAEFDANIMSGRYQGLHDFTEGLEPELWPRPATPTV
jgi:N-acyl amino acid synthase of PEP-CTERM/exosortase system